MGAVLGAASQDKVVLAMVLLFVVHLAGIGVLVALMGREVLDLFRTSPSSDDDDGGEPPTGDPVTPTPPSGGGLPLPDAAPSPKRLREPGRIGEKYPKPIRRPEHPPAPARDPARP